MASRAQEFAPHLIALLREHLPSDEPVQTLSLGRPNWIVAIRADGISVETERTRDTETGPQLVPAWMFEVAWQRLTARGLLTNAELLSSNDLGVKRSSLVSAVLARLPGVEVVSTRPIVLAYKPPA